MWPSLQLILSLKILLKIGAGTEKQRYLSSRGAGSVSGTPNVSIFFTTRCPQWLHVPKHQMFLQRVVLSSHCFTAFFFFFYKSGHCLSQETFLVSAFFSPELPSAPENSSASHIFRDLLHYVLVSLTQCMIFMELMFLREDCGKEGGSL